MAALEREGFLKSYADPDDGRKLIARLTPKGNAVIRKASEPSVRVTVGQARQHIFQIGERLDVVEPRRRDQRDVWADWPAFSAWKLARTHAWQPPRGISADWLKNLAPGQYVSLSDAVDLLAFGRAKISIGLSDIDEQATQLRAGIAIINAGIEGKVELLGTPCERLQTHPHLLRQTSHRIVIGSEILPDLIPVPFGGRDWLGPRRYADEYAEIGHAPHSVSFCDVRIERATLRKWLTTVSAKGPGPQGSRCDKTRSQ
jgi:DNA-binding MarR family transcriptional regulator